MSPARPTSPLPRNTPFSAMSPSLLPKPSPKLPSAHPEAEAAPDASIQADVTAKPAPASSMLLQSRRSGTSLPPEMGPLVVPYVNPDWSATPKHPFFLEVIENGVTCDKVDVSLHGEYLFGRSELCDFLLDDPTVSDFHAVLQYSNDGMVYLYDLASTHGSSINKTQIKKKAYTKIYVGNFMQFGKSSRMYFFGGPSELMPPSEQQPRPREPYTIPDWSATPKRPYYLQVLKNNVFYDQFDVSRKGSYIFGQDVGCDFELKHPTTSRFHAVLQYSNDGAVYLYDLGGTHGSSINKTQIPKNMYTEIRVGDLIIFGRSSFRYIFHVSCEVMSQEKDMQRQHDAEFRQDSFDSEAHKASLEEDVSNGKVFDDQTKKILSSQQSSRKGSVETADSLLGKKYIITNDIECKRKLIEEEKNKLAQRDDANLEDDLDAYMSDLGSQLEKDNIIKLEKEIYDLEAELARVVYLLKVAGPTEEAAYKRDLKSREKSKNKCLLGPARPD